MKDTFDFAQGRLRCWHESREEPSWTSCVLRGLWFSSSVDNSADLESRRRGWSAAGRSSNGTDRAAVGCGRNVGGPSPAPFVALGHSFRGKQRTRLHAAVAGRLVCEPEGLSWKVGRALFLSQGSDSGLLPRSPQLPGGSIQVCRAQCGGAWSEP